jgi:hypothetical protein
VECSNIVGVQNEGELIYKIEYKIQQLTFGFIWWNLGGDITAWYDSIEECEKVIGGFKKHSWRDMFKKANVIKIIKD